MIQVSLDTSFLISFADPTRAHHQAAVDYFKHCVANGFPIWVSTIVAGEFQAGQPFTDLPVQHFRIQPYNLPHALRAGDLVKFFHAQESSTKFGTRRIVINDVKIIAQAIEDEIPVILSEDENTLAKLTRQVQRTDKGAPSVLLLADGFTPGRLATPEQDEFKLPS